MLIRNIVGNVPEPHELYGRTALIAHLWRQLAGNNILLLAPRRFGKSGVMRHLLERPEQGFAPIDLDLMDVDSPAEFAVRLTGAVLAHNQLRSVLNSAKNLPAALKRFVTDTFDAVEFEGVKVELRKSIEERWRETMRHLVQELEKADCTVLFLLDEFPVMLTKMAEKGGNETACDFMAWFSSVRLQGKDTLQQVLGRACKHYFDHYRDRLARYGKPLERAAMAVLRAVSDAPLGRVSGSALYDTYRKARGRGSSEMEFDELIADLECDWYLSLDPQTNEYYFMVNVMRDWWRRWYGASRRGRTHPEGR